MNISQKSRNHITSHAMGQPKDSWADQPPSPNTSLTCKKPELLYIALYLTAIVGANISVAMFGPKFSILTALLFIGLDLTTRDELHELWSGAMLPFKMGSIIVLGSALSWVLNAKTGRIAIASLIAFALSATVDALTYTVLNKKSVRIRVNGSNILSSIADSVIFPTVAFGSFMPSIIIGQVAAKIVGGLLWFVIIAKIRSKH